MSLDLSILVTQEVDVCQMNITHNLTIMADQLGIYKMLWRPEEVGIETAGQLVSPLVGAIGRMKALPEYYKTFDAPNGWGKYEHFLPWLERLLVICQKYPNGKVKACR